ncbi:hypothetical protein FHETE_1871 [Fusarium heterosporum]|uniref:Uncharacterized protein n=1 Tax=Fusarium heterosporum TaxID=42747 RepID=A0A8H5X0V3_FUSHE|nr:hypothetical protein FHETE_1871 [Fusarium heterosporum]
MLQIWGTPSVVGTEPLIPNYVKPCKRIVFHAASDARGQQLLWISGSVDTSPVPRPITTPRDRESFINDKTTICLSLLEQKERDKPQKSKTYNSGDSLVVTDPTTNPPLTSLTMGERTGSRIFCSVPSRMDAYATER